MPESDAKSGHDPAIIRAALAQLLASPPFCKSAQLTNFLRFVVEETLAGRGDRIKAYTIATAALGRDEGFDPQADPIVRVEAARLRRALQNYYADQGRDAPIVIELPTGHYTPSFRAHADQFRRNSTPAAIRRLLRRATAIRVPMSALTIAILLASIIGAGIALWSTRHIKTTAMMISISDPKAPPYSDDPLPVVYVNPIDVTGTPVKSTITPLHLQIELCDALARFDEIIVTTDGGCGDPATNTTRPRAVKPKDIDYIVSGRLDYGDSRSVTVTLRLIARTDGMVVWTHTFQPLRLDADPDAAQDALVRRTATTLAQPTGVIQANERRRRTEGAKLDPRYSCLLDHNAYRQSFDPDAHERVKACLKRAIAQDPTFAPGFTALARIYVRQFYTQFGLKNDDLKPLDRALRLVQKAIALNPGSAEAYATLMSVLFARRDLSGARAAGQNAIMLNPNDVAIEAQYGFTLLRLGETDKAMPLMRKAIESGYLPSPIVGYGLFAGAYLNGNSDDARRYADTIATDNFPLGLTARALVAERSGDTAGAAKILQRLYTLQPGWKSNPRRELEKVFECKRIVDRFVEDLAAIGPQTN